MEAHSERGGLNCHFDFTESRLEFVVCFVVARLQFSSSRCRLQGCGSAVSDSPMSLLSVTAIPIIRSRFRALSPGPLPEFRAN